LKYINILKIFPIFIFVFSSTSISSQSKEHRRDLKEKIALVLSKKKYSESIPLLEEYTSKYPDDLFYSLYLAKSYLYKEDLGLSNPNFSEIQDIRVNYNKSLNIFTEKIALLEQKTPTDPILGEYYFYLGMVEMILGYDERSISKFQKSISYEYEKNKSYYNIAMIYEKMGNKKDSDRFFTLYNRSSSKEKSEGDNERKN
jgi:tetratricopeptide (TPR) repeat protein